MPTPIEQALTSLLPTTSPLPPELLALSASLLAQSRTKAANLKPEEEIGRTYACCHIACERLGHRLGLELVGKPAPPVKPRVYAKLRAFFNSVLRTTATGTSPRRGRGEDQVGKGHDGVDATRGGEQVTPVKSTAATPSSLRKRRAAGQGGHDDEVEVPDFVMPLVRHLCKEFDMREAAPHVFAGARSVLNERQQYAMADVDETSSSAKKQKIGDRTRTSTEGQRTIEDHVIPALVVALYVATTIKMSGRNEEGSLEHRDSVVGAAKEYCDERQIATSRDWHEDVKNISAQAQNTWSKMEWYHNVPEPRAAEVDGEPAEDEDEDDAYSKSIKLPYKTPLRRKEKHGAVKKDDAGAAGLLPGLGTMFQPAVDWLSDERRADYARWKKEILRQLAVI